ncbi:hypothetical protein TWF730_006684 [Orbilia blumenaviensis]|uniref:Uncharacterized protein n=1 Tax=Orbilia blumenaviensis TaxID=1796055 RepID=A0AAV9VHF1_9PEZI
MRSSGLLLVFASQLLAPGQALAIAAPEGMLDRMHYGIGIRDILDHVYGKQPLQKRSDGEVIPTCRLGGEAHYEKNGTLMACSYDTSPENYNKAIRAIHARLTRRSLDTEPPVYYSKRAPKDNGKSWKGMDDEYKINGGGRYDLPDNYNTIPAPGIIPRPDYVIGDAQGLGTEPTLDNDGKPITTLPPGWTLEGARQECHESGTWAKLTEMSKIRGPWCRILHEARNVAVIRHISFLKASADPTLPGKLLRDSAGRPMSINTEYFAGGLYPGENDVYALCIIGTMELRNGPCHGQNDDTRGGWQGIVREGDNMEAERSVTFGWDPNTGPKCC